MPYIKNENRVKFDSYIDALAKKLCEEKFEPGEFNYVVSRLIWKIFTLTPSYTLGNNLIGALECIKSEFYRRLLTPYEEKKIVENGDLYL
jgi:hypothetical protein